jgi:hypothetical protein
MPDQGRKPSRRTDQGPSDPQLTSPETTAGIPKFVARCESHSSETANSLRHFSVVLSQRLRSHGVEQAWDIVIIRCDEEPDNTLITRVIVSNPDWSERIEIARLRSRPGDADVLTALGCNLNHRRVAL